MKRGPKAKNRKPEDEDAGDKAERDNDNSDDEAHSYDNIDDGKNRKSKILEKISLDDFDKEKAA